MDTLIDVAKIQFRQTGHVDPAARDINVLCERLANHPRLFVNFLEHKVPVLALVGGDGRGGDPGWRTLKVFAFHIEKIDSLPRDHCEVAVFQVTDHVGHRRKSDRVGPEVHFASSISDRKRRSLARPNDQVFVAFKQEGQRKRSLQSRQRGAYRLYRLATFLQLLVYKMGDHLGVCFGDKARPCPLKLVTQLAMIFDDAVMNDRNAINRVRMRVLLIWTAMGCPSRVANAYAAGKRFTS